MINIKKYIVGFLSTNCYLVWDKKIGFVVDPGRGFEKISKFAEENDIIIKAVLLTHGHFDHILDVQKWQDYGAKIYILSDDADKLYTPKNLGASLKLDIPPMKADILLNDGDTVEIGEMSVKVLHTPGHSVGSACFILKDNIFSGDTLFASGYGRTDFPDGSISSLRQSIAKLFALDGDYKVYPGHDVDTTLDIERNNCTL